MEKANKLSINNENKIFFDSFFESNIGLIAFALDTSYKYLYFNELHKSIVMDNWSIEIKVGTSILDCILEKKDKLNAKKHFDKALSGKKFLITEKNKDYKLSRKFWQTSYSPIYDNDNKIIGLSVLELDKNSELSKIKSLNNTVSNLSISNNTKDRLISVIAHDIKAPLMGFLGLTEILKKSFDINNQDILEVIEDLNNSALNMQELINNLLDWTKSETGKLKTKADNINLYLIASSVKSLLEYNSKPKGLAVIIDIDKNLTCYADAFQITTVLRNLVSNAIKFTAKGSITINAKSSKKNIIVSVKDTGSGMTKEELDDIMIYENSFSKIGTSNETGTGIGLTLCRDFIRNNKGKLWVDSELNIGTTFYFSLPFKK